MPITITDSDNISNIHTAARLQIELSTAKEIVEEMSMEIFFIIETQLPNGKTIGQPYWDNEPLRINCKDKPELITAMKVIQQAIGEERYRQIIALNS